MITTQRYSLARRSSRDHAWVLLEMVAAMILVGILATCLAMVEGRHQNAMRLLADSRRAGHAAEAALLRLQTGDPSATPVDAAATVTVILLKDASPLPRCAWVEVKCAVAGREQSVIGLVPIAKLPKSLEGPK